MVRRRRSTLRSLEFMRSSSTTFESLFGFVFFVVSILRFAVRTFVVKFSSSSGEDEDCTTNGALGNDTVANNIDTKGSIVESGVGKQSRELVFGYVDATVRTFVVVVFRSTVGRRVGTVMRRRRAVMGRRRAVMGTVRVRMGPIVVRGSAGKFAFDPARNRREVPSRTGGKGFRLGGVVVVHPDVSRLDVEFLSDLVGGDLVFSLIVDVVRVEGNIGNDVVR
jgi:hypothetical protein